ncbi:putative cytochrome P450 49a1 [Papilio machaon]|uniref:Putative cytochrome P450 49a1 n=1 Tax=Papilio machaon TaxID=76193 RepID=A0A194RG02_PAPMA|nr:putative cytochrome P450 49a1 [Papilio machaon]
MITISCWLYTLAEACPVQANVSVGKPIQVYTLGKSIQMANFLVASIPRQSRRRLSGSGQRGAATSPQRRAAPAPAPQPRPFTHIPGPLALPMLRHSAYVLPRIGNFHHSVGLGLLEGLRSRYGDLVRLAKASRKRPVLYVFDPDIMKEVYESKVTQPPQWEHSPLHEQRRHTANQHTSQRYLAQTALSMFYQLSLHAAQQQRAHDEVSWSAAARAAGAPHHSCTRLPYLRACANEALRLFPVTGGVVRRSTEEMVLAGYEIPAGVDIVLAHGITSKDEKQWGRGKSFIPERWCSEGWEPLRATRAHPTSSKPFGERCPASGVVSNMLAALATRVLDRYRLEWHGPAPTVAIAGVNKLQPPYYFVLQNAS